MSCMELKYIHAFGIDVHKDCHTGVLVLIDGTVIKEFNFGNCKEKVTQIVQELSASYTNLPFILEDVHGNGLFLSNTLKDLGIDVRHRPSIHTRRTNKSVKSDSLDAKRIALGFLHDINSARQLSVFENKYSDFKRLVEYRKFLIEICMGLKNQLHANYHRKYSSSYRKILGYKDAFCPSSITKQHEIYKHWDTLEDKEIYLKLDTLATLQAQIKDLEKDLQTMHKEEVKALCELPGVSKVTAFELLATIQDIHRFKSDGHLASYFKCGLKDYSSSGKTKHRHQLHGNPLIYGIARTVISPLHKYVYYQELYKTLGQNAHAIRVIKRKIVRKIYKMLRNVQN